MRVTSLLTGAFLESEVLLLIAIGAALCTIQPSVDAVATIRDWLHAAGLPQPVAEDVVAADGGRVSVALDAARLAAPGSFIPGRLDPALGSCRLANAARLELDLGELVELRSVSRRDTEPDLVITGRTSGDGWIEVDHPPPGWLPAAAGAVTVALTGEPLPGPTRASLLTIERRVERVRLRFEHGGAAKLVFARSVTVDALARSVARLTGQTGARERHWTVGRFSIALTESADGPVVEITGTEDQDAG